jgi:hypothetical protein
MIGSTALCDGAVGRPNVAASSSSRVYGCSGVVNTEATGPDSTTAPSRITSTRSHTVATTGRSCVMNSSAGAIRFAEEARDEEAD